PCTFLLFSFLLFLLRHRPPLLPYTTLFRSRKGSARLPFLLPLSHSGFRRLGRSRWNNITYIAACAFFPIVIIVSIIHDLNGTISDRKSTRLNSSHVKISYAVFCLKKKKYQN